MEKKQAAKKMPKMDHRAIIEGLRHRMNSGEITYEQAQAHAEPVIKDMNARAEKVAKKFGQKAPKFTFRYLTR